MSALALKPSFHQPPRKEPMAYISKIYGHNFHWHHVKANMRWAMLQNFRYRAGLTSIFPPAIYQPKN